MLNWFTLLVAIINLLFGLFVLSRGRQGLYISFFIFTIANSFWALTTFYHHFTLGLVEYRSIYFAGSLVVASVLLWLEFLINPSGKHWKKYFFIIFGIAFSSLAFAGGMVIKDVNIPENSFIPGTFFNIFTLIPTLGLMYMFYFLITNIKKSNGLRKTQLYYVLLGVGGFAIFGMSISTVPPLLGNKYQMVWEYPFDIWGSLVFVGFAGASIVKHKFMDIRLVVARSFAYLILILAFTFTYAVLALGLERLILGHAYPYNSSFGVEIIRVSIAIIMAVGFAPAKNFITAKTDRLFFRRQYDPQQLLHMLSVGLGESASLAGILQKSCDILAAQMNISKIEIVIFNKNKKFMTKMYGTDQPINIPFEQIRNIFGKGIINPDNLNDNDTSKETLRQYDIKLFIPLKTASQYLGAIFLGEKSNGQLFDSQDIKIMNIVSPEIALNAELWLKVEQALFELRESNKHLVELDHSKSEFMNMIAHNLRTPITIIEGYLSFLLEQDNYQDTTKTRFHLSEMEDGITRLSTLTEEIILATSIISNKRKITIEEFNVKDIFKELESRYSKIINDRKVVIKYKFETEIMRGDINLIKIVLSNLFENAVKFNKLRGKVNISQKINSKKEFEICFEDTGIGIPKEKQGDLFKKFMRETDLYKYNYEGIGLGLYLVKLIINLIDGQVSFISQPNEGSKFFVGFKQ